MANFSSLILGAIIFVLIFNYSHTKSTIENTTDVLQWDWDAWCQLQPKIGNCDSPHKYFYYDTQLDTCREFTFLGCNGNENKFHTRKACEQLCKGFGHVGLSKSLSPKEKCSLQANPGTCISYVPHYYYDLNTEKCMSFVFGGCGGNANRFRTEEDCLSKCSGVGAGGRPPLRTNHKTNKKHH